VGVTRLALKVDVDTHAGLRDGVPVLLDLFRRHGLSAAFFVSFGPDHSGRALLRVFRRPGFLTKMLRTKALSTYGWRTILSGTILRGHLIGPSFPQRLERILHEGHELGLHGYDHVLWHDNLLTLPKARIQDEFMRGFEAFRRAVGRSPSASAAPGWQCNTESLAVQDELSLLYHSDTRGEEPYLPQSGGRVFNTLEIPTTLPTWDEIWEARAPSDVPQHLISQLKLDRLNVLTLHAEIEGRVQQKPFEQLLKRCRELDVRFVRLEDEAKKILSDKAALPILGVRSETRPGRAGVVSCAAPVLPKSLPVWYHTEKA
jgi:undecaprenyl phosphate-alpha-L-ara4FN deformylase